LGAIPSATIRAATPAEPAELRTPFTVDTLPMGAPIGNLYGR
jgi:hypothetical protein